MSDPAIRPGVIEQAIYTWSKKNLVGDRGQGFGALSPGLRSSAAWLSSLGSDHFALLDEGLRQTSNAYAGWQQQVVTGAFHAGDVNVVYRKIARAGVDAGSRNRWVVHILAGRPGELDLAAVDDDDAHWLTAADCPLDDLPALSELDASTLVQRRVARIDETVEALARELIAKLRVKRRAHLGREAPLPPETLTAALLIAVPTALWPQIELDWYVGTTGPVARVDVSDNRTAVTVYDERAQRAGLDDSALHREVDRVWAELAAGDRSWPAFVTAFAHRTRSGAFKPATAAGTVSAHSQALAEAEAPTSLLTETIGTAIGDDRWHHDRPLDDANANRALGALAKLETPTGGWLTQLDALHLHALLSGIEETGTFMRAVGLLGEDSEVTIGRLANAWRSTSLAPLGFALIRRDPGQVLSGRWAVPRSIDAGELRKLVAHTLRRGVPGPGSEMLSRLLHGGFSSHATARRSLIDALDAANVTERQLFEAILLPAELSASALLDFMRDDVDAVGRWLRLPSPYAKALRLGLARRRRSLNPLRRS